MLLTAQFLKDMMVNEWVHYYQAPFQCVECWVVGKQRSAPHRCDESWMVFPARQD